LTITTPLRAFALATNCLCAPRLDFRARLNGKSMFVIRKEQLEAFGPLGKKAFEDRVIAHLKKVFPERSHTLGELKLRETIQFATQRAAAYRITSERDVCKYIDLMILYGRDFDKDPNLPWALAILQNQTIRNPSSKIERLYKAAKKQENKPQPRKKS